MKSEKKRSKKSLAIVLTAMMVLSVCVAGIVPVGAQQSVERSIEPDSVAPGEVVNVTITFTTTQDYTFPMIEDIVPLGWNVTDMRVDEVTNEELSLAKFYDTLGKVVFAWLRIPFETLVEAEYKLHVPIDAEAGEYTITGTLIDMINDVPICPIPTGTVVVSLYDVNLTVSPEEQPVAPDETATYTLTVTNLGNDADTIDLAITGNEADFGELSEHTFALSAGASDTAYLNVSHPNVGIYDTTVTATSQTNPAEMDTVTVTTNVTEVELGSVAGTITYACNATGIEGATVKLTQGGTEVNSTTTDANGDYEFTDVTPGDYYVNASKTRFWDNSTDVTITAGGMVTADMMLWLKGDLDNDGISASEDDLVLMFKAYLKFIEPNWRYDLNEDGELADEDDLVLMFKAYLGFITLE
ncbi:MAG: carboxypeptidase regulatory-like domain-containing protein [Halobacteriota archaeon]